MLTYTPQGRCTGSMLHCNTALLFSMHPAEHGMAAGLTAITQLSVRLCVSHCGLWVQKGTQSRCRVRTSPVTGLSPSQRGTATCPVASTTWLLASLILFKGLKPPGGPTVRSSQTNNLFSSFLFKDVFNLQTAVTGCPKWEVIFKKKLFLCLWEQSIYSLQSARLHIRVIPHGSMVCASVGRRVTRTNRKQL